MVESERRISIWRFAGSSCWTFSRPTATGSKDHLGNDTCHTHFFHQSSFQRLRKRRQQLATPLSKLSRLAHQRM